MKIVNLLKNYKAKCLKVVLSFVPDFQRLKTTCSCTSLMRGPALIHGQVGQVNFSEKDLIGQKIHFEKYISEKILGKYFSTHSLVFFVIS